MTKIVFVYPDFESLGVASLMAVCREAGYNVELVFYKAEDRYIGGKGKGIPFDDVAGRVALLKPQVAVFSCVTDNYQYQLGVAKALKALMPEVITLFGGVHPTAVPDRVLGQASVDAVCIGEGEIALLEFLRECRFDPAVVLPDHVIKGIAFKTQGATLGQLEEGVLPDLNALPFPHKAAFYSQSKNFSREYLVMTSRGCPYDCSYCFNSYMRQLRGRNILRQRTVDNVIAELKFAKQEYSPRYVTFLDDCFTTHDAWVMEFCARYKKEIGIPFACMAIPQYLSKDKVKALSDAGLFHVVIGVQSLDKDLCRNILHRKSDNSRAADTIKMLREAGVVVQADHMLGFPDDSVDKEAEAILFYNQHRPHILSVFWLTYYPKTAIVGIARQRGVLSDADIENMNEGRTITDGSLHSGGSVRDPKPYYGVSLIMHWLPLLPKGFVRFLINRGIHKKALIGNVFISVLLPRFILAVIHRKNFRDRTYLLRFIKKVFHQSNV